MPGLCGGGCRRGRGGSLRGRLWSGRRTGLYQNAAGAALSKAPSQIAQDADARLYGGPGVRILPQTPVYPAGHEQDGILVHTLRAVRPDAVDEIAPHGILFVHGLAVAGAEAVHRQLGGRQFGLGGSLLPLFGIT